MWNVQISAASGNSKTGPIPTTSRPQDTCPTSCPFFDAGCYGKGRIFALADKYANEHNESSMTAVLSKARKAARIVRDRVVGDLLDTDGNVDYAYMRAIAAAARVNGLRVFGYTHVPLERLDLDSVPENYVLNISTETPDGAAAAIRAGFDAVMVNDDIAEGTMIEGKRIVTCPAQTREGITCATCGLCSKKNRKSIIRFLTHGAGKRKAAQAVRKANA